MPTSNLSGQSYAGPGASGSSRVSVVIAAFNAAQTLHETIDSLLAQTLAPWEIIVVDDGSTDKTAEILERYGASIKTVRQPHAGLATARNTGCAAASGDLIAFIDADDVGAPERLAVQVACMASDPAIVLCHSDFSTFGDNIEATSTYFRTYYALASAAGAHIDKLLGPSRDLVLDGVAGKPEERIRLYVGHVYERIAHGNFVHPPTMMFRRDLFAKAGPFDVEIRNMCDWDWIVRASRHGAFAFIDKPLLAYRLSPGQLSGPKHGAQARLDTIQVAERIRRRDAQLYEKDRPKFRAELGYFYLSAADALADSSTAAALSMLRMSIGYGVLDRQTLPVLIKALLPTGVLTALRHARRTFEASLARQVAAEAIPQRRSAED